MHPANTWVSGVRCPGNVKAHVPKAVVFRVPTYLQSSPPSTFEGTLQLRGFLRKTIFHPLFPPQIKLVAYEREMQTNMLNKYSSNRLIPSLLQNHDQINKQSTYLC